MDVDEFIKGFKENYHERTKLIRDHLKKGETFDDTPEIFLLEREYTVDLTKTFEEIENNYHNNTLTIPLKSFFGNITKRNNIRRKEPSIVIYDKRVNINQMRVIYNALKYPVTYVQGPPGTGKTQTILNVILSAFFEGKTMLVCSANNKPVDGIIENLKFKYKNEEVLFPFLRVGKYEEVIEATKKIKSLYEFKTKEDIEVFEPETAKSRKRRKTSVAPNSLLEWVPPLILSTVGAIGAGYFMGMAAGGEKNIELVYSAYR